MLPLHHHSVGMTDVLDACPERQVPTVFMAKNRIFLVYIVKKYTMDTALLRINSAVSLCVGGRQV